MLDTNILLRIGEVAHPHHPHALEAVRSLASAGNTFCIGSQTVSEFLAVATRPIEVRGLGMDQQAADAQLAKVTSAFDTLYDSPAVIGELRRLVMPYRVSGKAVHDARLVATMNMNDVSDFTRYAEITVHDPVAISMATRTSESHQG